MFTRKFLAASLLAGVTIFTACSKSDDNNNTVTDGPADYLLGVGVTANSATTNYVVKATTLMQGTVDLKGNGLTLINYRDYAIGNNVVFALGGLGSTDVNGVTQDAITGKLSAKGTTSFDAAVNDIVQVDADQMLAITLPGNGAGDKAVFRFIGINSLSVNKEVSVPVGEMAIQGDNPIYTGSVVRGSQLFVGYTHFDTLYNTRHVDTNYVAVYSYPELQLQHIIIDTRTGPTGAWATKNGLFKTENGDIYAMSSSNISNGYSKSTKPGGFLRIASGSTSFDQSYFFNTDLSGGKISHIKYLGNNKVFAAISTLTTQTADDRWGDKKLKLAIIDVVAKTITDVKLNGDVNALIHDGVGGRSFPVLAANAKVYYPITNTAGTYIYEIDPATATATRGARVNATFVGGIFKVK
jgi:hypothetical protein